MKSLYQVVLGVISFLLLISLAVCGGDGGGGTGPDDPTGGTDEGIGATGGTASLQSGTVTLVVPAGALSSSVTFTAQTTSTAPSSGLVVTGSTYDIGPSGTTFAQPVTLTLGYSASSLPTGVAEGELRLFKAVNGAWELMPSGTANAASNTVSGSVSSLSTFGVLGLPVTSVTVTPASGTVAVGEALALTAAPMNGSVSLSGRTVTFATSDAGVATVGASGSVTGVGAGTATITATSEGVDGTAQVTVTVPVATVEVTTPEDDVSMGNTLQATATAKDAAGNTLSRDMTWTSADATVATVSSSGLITPVAVGTVEVTAAAEGVSGSVTIQVLDPVVTVEVTPSESSLTVGATVLLAAVAKGFNGNVLVGTETWASEDEAVATVDGDGLVTGVAAGTTNIMATVDGVQGLAEVAVTFNVAGFAGAWGGTWVNQTFGSNGPAAMTVTLDEEAKTIQVVWDLDGFVFGASDPPADTFNGTYTADAFTVTGTSPTFGNVQLGGDFAGFTGQGLAVPNVNIDSVDFTGTMSDTQVIMNYVVNFTGGGTADGVITLNKT